MTRKEETENAIKSHAPCFWDIDGKHYLMTYGEIRASHDGFRKGVEWADKNPKSPWISVEDDLPCNHKDLIEYDKFTKCVLVVWVLDNNPALRHIEIDRMIKEANNWHWNNIQFQHITHWMSISELPK